MRRFLLDTHIFLWLVATPERVSENVRIALGDPRSEVFFSAVLAWEITVKRAKGKLHFALSPQRAAQSLRFKDLPITANHCEVSAGLQPLHRDPFDRLLIAQAETESLILVTQDAMLARYGIPIMQNGA